MQELLDLLAEFYPSQVAFARRRPPVYRTRAEIKGYDDILP